MRVTALLLGIPLCVFAQPGIDRSKLVDLSYAFDEHTLYWPTAKPFEWKKDAWGVGTGGYFYASASFTVSEHCGTHLDSPIHFAEGKLGAADIPLDRLVGPARVIDVRRQAAAGRNYRVTTGDVEAYEKQHGRLATGDIVLVLTGWGKYWPNRKQYFGSDKLGDASELSFPGIGKEAAELLVRRQVSGVGIDTASIDYGPSQDFIAHRILNGANIYALENLAQLDRLPPKGATLIALPVKVKGGTGGPARVIALLF